MRIHTNTLTASDLDDAARIARVEFGRMTEHGSRSRDHAFDVTLTGESKRRPNGGTSGASDDYAATWDQWGVFLGVLFDRDPEMTCRAYKDFVDFDYVTKCRFVDRGVFPDDYHGDHTFRWNGIPRQQDCTKCSASYQWS